ncbi:MAG: cytochrome bc complex cytochrome b subunit [Thermoplasmata archaeon]|nr:cytochrome bc complex cytochrome b subunit [Thermoplasmata archaeon]
MSFTSWYNRTLNQIWGFVEDRTSMRKWALRPQPQFTFKPSYWTGGFVVTAFLYQVVSGMLLLLYYQPSTNTTLTACGQPVGTQSIAPAAWCSTYYIIHSVPMGQLLLSSHLYGAYAMIFLMFVHFFRGYYLGVYKAPREFSWMVGTLLLVMTLGMGFTGYLLPYTQISYNATNVGLVLALRLPTVGPLLGPFILADGTSQGLLSRMFDAHVLLLPLALGALLYAHIALFESHGIAPQATSDPLQRRRFTEKEDKQGVPFMPHIFWYITKWGLLYVGLLLGIAALWPWNLPTYVGNLAAAGVVTEPDWYFLWLFKLVDFAGVTPVLAIGITNVLLLYVLFLPFLDRTKRTHPRDRPLFIWLATSLVGFFILMTVWGGETPGQQIALMSIVYTIGPIFAVNAVVTGLFYWRYRRSYLRRLQARESSFTGSYSPPTPLSIDPHRAVAEAKSGE